MVDEEKPHAKDMLEEGKRNISGSETEQGPYSWIDRNAVQSKILCSKKAEVIVLELLYMKTSIVARML